MTRDEIRAAAVRELREEPEVKEALALLESIPGLSDRDRGELILRAAAESVSPNIFAQQYMGHPARHDEAGCKNRQCRWSGSLAQCASGRDRPLCPLCFSLVHLSTAAAEEHEQAAAKARR